MSRIIISTRSVEIHPCFLCSLVSCNISSRLVTITMEIRSGSHVNGRKHVAGRDGQKSSSKSIPALLPSVLQLQQILDNPIRFGPATRLTYEDEARMGSKGLKWSTASEHCANVRQESLRFLLLS